MKRKKGIITLKDATELRDNAIEATEWAKKEFKDLTPCRVDNNTIILIRSDRDKNEQINHFRERLEKYRMNL